MDFKEVYKLQAEQHKVSNEVLQATKRRMMESRKKVRHRPVKMMVFAAAMVACMGMTTFAYEFHQNQQFYKLKNINTGGNHDYLDQEDNKVQSLDETDSMANISMTLTNVKADYNNMYLTVVLKTVDGSELNINTENYITVLEGQTFEKAYFTVDGTNVDFTRVTRTDDGSDATEAVFELWYSDTESYISTFVDPGKSLVRLKTMQGKDINIVLGNYSYSVMKTQNIRFAFSDLGIMLENLELGAENQRIYFSTEYPETYIDKAEIVAYGDLNYKCLHVSIVPESEVAKNDLLSKLAVLNRETGKLIVSFKDIAQEGNRLEFVFDAGRGIYNETTKENHSDTTVDLLKKYIFTLRNGSEIRTVDGTCELNFNLEKVNLMLTYEPQVTIQRNNQELVINKIELSDSNLGIVGTIPPNFSLKPLGKVYLIMSDGTKVDVGNKISCGANSMTGGELRFICYLKTLVDAGDVTGVEIFDNVIELK